MPATKPKTNQTEMKTKSIILWAALAAFVLPVGAQDTPVRERVFGDGTLPEFLRQFDVNEDGVIDEEERQAIKEVIRERTQKRVLEKWDSDGDGVLSPEERLAMFEELRARILEKRTARFNAIAGEDGVLTLEEFAALPVMAERTDEEIAAIFAKLDTDGNGEVTLTEFLARLRPPQPRPGPGPGPLGGGSGS
jgi:Ca2+-binding EF-hand superfamily protein